MKHDISQCNKCCKSATYSAKTGCTCSCHKLTSTPLPEPLEATGTKEESINYIVGDFFKSVEGSSHQYKLELLNKLINNLCLCAVEEERIKFPEEFKQRARMKEAYDRGFADGKEVHKVKGERNRLIAMAKEEERQAWLTGYRCIGCGVEQDNQLSDMCGKCLEEL